MNLKQTRSLSFLKMPVARNIDLIVQELPDEMLVYDNIKHKAYYLDLTTSLIWKYCDGKTKMQELPILLKDVLKKEINITDVEIILSKLEQSSLLQKNFYHFEVE